MTFGSMFGRVLSPTFQPKSQAAKAVSGVLIYDTFTDTNGTYLKNHTISPTNTPATSWATVSGKTDEKVNNNHAGYGDNAHCWSYLDAGVADCKITTSTLFMQTGIGGNSTGLWLRGGAYFVLVGYGGGREILAITANDKATILAQDNPLMTSDLGSVRTLTVTLNGATITAALDNGLTCTYTSATTNQTATTHGLTRYYYDGAGGTYVDDIKIETL